MAVLGEAELLYRLKNEETKIVFEVDQENVTPILQLDIVGNWDL